jgi:hypothetical protein
MTQRQKRIITLLAVANIVVILALLSLVTQPSGTGPSALPTPHSPSAPRQTCQWHATQLLARAGLGGTVTLTPDGPLRFEIAYPLAPGQTADEAAQAAWAAFEVALTLQEAEDECASFTQVEVMILAQDHRTDAQINVSVSGADLMAFDAGELSEDQFIERVSYSISIPQQP